MKCPKIYTPRIKYGHPGVPIFFRDPVAILGAPFSTQVADDTGDAYDSGGEEWPSVNMPIQVVEANSGSRDHVPGQMEGSC